MKKLFMVLLVIFAMSFSVFAGGLDDQVTVMTDHLVLVKAGSCELVQLTAIADANENTLEARVWYVYDSATTAGAGTASFAFAITKTVGVYFDGDLFKGFMGSGYFGATVADGISFDSGIVISPTAGTTGSWIAQYR